MRAHNFSRKDRAEIARRAGFKCQFVDDEGRVCGLQALPGEADHILPVAMGGESEPDNGRWLCITCHKIKSKADAGVKAKSDAVRDRYSGVRKKSDRGFRRWRRFDGSIVERRD